MRKIATNRFTSLHVLASLFLLLPLSIAQSAENVQTSRTGAVAIAAPQEQESFTFIVFGDRTSEKTIGTEKGLAVLRAAVADANRLSPAFVMNVGDMVQGYNTTKQWIGQMEVYQTIMNELHCPWYPTVGNHDVYGKLDSETGKRSYNDEAYEKYFAPFWYAFEYKNNLFIVLYTDEGDPKTGEKTYQKPEGQMMSDDQFQWLQSVLDKSKDMDGIYIFQHHPRWRHVEDFQIFDNKEYGNNWNQVHEAFVKAGNVKVIFAGHIHRITQMEKDGIRYLTLATTGGNMPEYDPASGRMQEIHHVTVRKNAEPVIAILPVKANYDETATDAIISLPQPLSEQPKNETLRKDDSPVMAP